MPQTAMQEAIDWVNKNYPNFNHADIEAKLTQLLEKEKQQIIDVFCAGDKSDCTSDQNSKYFAEQYYNEQYGV